MEVLEEHRFYKMKYPQESLTRLGFPRFYKRVPGHFGGTLTLSESQKGKYFLENEVVVLLVGGEGHDAQDVLSGLKKKNGKDGLIREKFQNELKASEDDLGPKIRADVRRRVIYPQSCGVYLKMWKTTINLTSSNFIDHETTRNTHL